MQNDFFLPALIHNYVEILTQMEFSKPLILPSGDLDLENPLFT